MEGTPPPTPPGNGWTRHEYYVLHKLQEMQHSIDSINRELRERERKFANIERDALSPERVALLIEKALEEKEAKGFTLRSQLLAGVVALCAIATFILAAYSAFSGG